jgi:excisionase family DNA binding protein
VSYRSHRNEPAQEAGRPEIDATVPATVDGSAASSRRREPGLTVSEVARRYRVGEDKVRAWIRKGELRAVNTAAVLCGRPRWVISEEALAEFERRRSSAPPAKPPTSRRRNVIKDFYP